MGRLGRHCSYGLCNSDSDKDPNLRWAQFPQPKRNISAAKKWVQLVGRAHFTIKNVTRHTFVCEKHFPEGAVLDVQSNPTLQPYPLKKPAFDQFPAIISRKKRGRKEGNEQSKKNNHTNNDGGSSVENKVVPNLSQESVAVSPPYKIQKSAVKTSYKRVVDVKRNITLTFPPPQKTPEKINQGHDATKTHVSVACQVDVPKKAIVEQLEAKTADLEEKLRSSQSLSAFILESEEKAQYYTGLDKTSRDAIWNFLGEAKDHLHIFGTKKLTSGKMKKLSVSDQFLLTLFKLRCNYPYADLEYRYGVNRKTLARVFKTWLQFMFLKFKAIEKRMFTLKSDLPQPLPKAFMNSLLKDTRVVIDCSELFIESSSDFEAQGNVFSSYKHHTTAKVLIGVAPSGGAIFVSDCFEGAVSDREIVVQSGFLDQINGNDLVLADRGFTIDDLLAEKGARLNIPPFLKGRPNFSLAETKKTKLIARARIHVERFNQRFKRYRFLKGIIPQYHLDVLTQAVFVCCCLTNFDQPLAV